MQQRQARSYHPAGDARRSSTRAGRRPPARPARRRGARARHRRATSAPARATRSRSRPTGAVLAELEPEQVTRRRPRRRAVVDGELAPTSELDLHLGVYRRYDAGAVVHTHAPMATALSCVLDELPCVHYQMLLLGGTVPVAPYATFGTPELAELGARRARGPHRGADGQPRRDRPRRGPRRGASSARCCSSGPAPSTGAPRARRAARARRRAAARRWSAAALARGYGSTHRSTDG